MKTNKAVKQWVKETKRCYNVLKSLRIKDLKLLGYQAGLDLNHYKTKSMLAKGLLITSTGRALPLEIGEWK